jgi:DNA-binding CsgD family transcriptional regulator
MARALDSETVLLGRERECAWLAEMLDDVQNGQSRALVLRGDPGIGKTALLEYATERAEGFRILRAVGIESESKLAFSGLHQLLLPVLGELDQVPEAAAEALSRSLALAAPGEVNPFLAYAAVLQLLAAAAEREPILAVVDDAHWLDPASAEAITFVARRLEAESVALLFAVREGEATRLDTRGIPDLRVEGLSAEAAHELLSGTDGGAIAAGVAGRLVDATTGNPLALLEIPRTLSDAQRYGKEALDDPIAVGESVERAFLSRARSLSPEAGEALLVAAASDTGDLAAIARACGGSAAPLDEAEVAGLVKARGGELSFRHPLVRSAVYSAATAGARREAHLALAEAFGAEDADRRAWHLAAATVGPDDEVAAALEDAADRARDRGGAGAEARLLERSATLTRDAGLRASRLARAGWAAFSAGWSDESLALVEQGLELAQDPLTRADLYDALGFLSWSKASYGEHYETFIAEAESVQDVDPLRAARLLWHASGELSLRSEIDRHRQLVERTWSLVDGGDDEQISYGLTARAWQAVLDGQLSEGIDLARRGAAIVEAREELTVGGLLIDFAECLTALEQYEVARRLLEQALPVYRDRGELVALIAALSVLADLELHRGRLERASAAATEALERARELDLTRHVAWALVGLAGIEAVLGRVDDCRAHVAEAIATRAPADTVVEAHALDAIGRLELGAGRAQESIPCFERVRELAGSAAGATPLLRWRPDLIEAYVRTKRLPEAAAELAAFERLEDTGLGPWATATLARSRALLANEGSLDDAFAEALSSCTDSVSPFERARTELVYGERLRRAGRRLDSRAQLRASLDEFERLGASSWAERAREELRASGETVRKRDPALVDELTPRELEIALQVADGGTNKEVAARLFLSPKTVELHLGRVYRKLGIRSRTELARLMPR